MSEAKDTADNINVEKRRRRRRQNGDDKTPIKVVSSLGEGKLIDRFQSAVSEKKERKKRHEKNEKTRQLQKEKRKKDVAKFKAEGKFEELEKRKQEEERKKAENERKKRIEKDIKDKKMIEIEIAKKKSQNRQNNDNDEDNIQTKKKTPGKLKSRNFEEIARQKEETNFQDSEIESILASNSGSHGSVNEVERRKKKLTKRRKKTKSEVNDGPSKLDTSKLNFDVIEKQRVEQERWKIQEQRRKLLEEEKRLFEEARQHRLENQHPKQDDSKVKSSDNPSKLDYSKTRFDIMAQHKMEEEKQRIREERSRLLREEKKLFEEERKRIEMEQNEPEKANADETAPKRLNRKPSRLDKSFTEFDILEKKKKEEEREQIMRESQKKLEEEKQLFREAKKMMDSDSEVEESKCDVSPNRLPSVLTNFEETEQRRSKLERALAQERKIKEIEEELQRFKEERQLMNDSDKEERTEVSKPQVKQPRPKKLSAAFTKFDEIARLNQERENQKRKEEKSRELEEERIRFQASKENDIGSNSDDDDKFKRIHRPINKLNVRDQMEAVLQAQREAERQRIMETKFCRMTVEQQEMFLAKEAQLNMLREKLARAQDEDDYESYTSDDDSEEYENVHERSDESEDSSEVEIHDPEGDESDVDSRASSLITEGTGSSDSGYNGAPWFTETLSNIALREGKPVRFDAVIHADPHPKVTWYFKDRLIRNSPDYHYINKGTQYSLYMNESFFDDSGEYVCKAENSKGIATSTAILTIIDG